MAYRCPVCDTPQTDAEHLANHLAFTAVIHGDDHETWLDEHVPEWGESNPETLAPKVAEAVPEVDVPEFDDGDEHAGHEHGATLEDELAQQSGHRGPGSAGTRDAASSTGGRGDLAEDAAGVLQEARELTEEMYGLDDGEGNADETADDAVNDADDAVDDDADDSASTSESE